MYNIKEQKQRRKRQEIKVVDSFDSFKDTYAAVYERLDISEIAKNNWIKPVSPIKMEKNHALLYVNSSFVKQILEENYAAEFEERFSELFGFPVKVDFLDTRGLTPALYNECLNRGIKILPPDKQTSAGDIQQPVFGKEPPPGLYEPKPDSGFVLHGETADLPDRQDLPITGQDIDINEPDALMQMEESLRAKISEAIVGSEYKYTFDTFIVGESNKLAFVACQAVAKGERAKNGSKPYNPLYVYSEPGLGKTHLLHAIRYEVEKYRPGEKVVIVQCDNFVNEFVTSLHLHTTDEFKRRYASADVLLLDDVQSIAGKKESQNELFVIFNMLYESGKQIVLTSDRPPKEINNIETRLLSRFEWGLLADIDLPEFETRLAIVNRKAQLLGFELPENVANFIADRLKNNIRQIEGAIIKLHATCQVGQVACSLGLAQNIIRDVLTEQLPVPVTIERILADTGAIYSVSPEEIRSASRNAQISTARQTAIYAVHKIVGLSYSEIGKEFGGRDHSTIVYALSKVKKTMKEDKNYRQTIEDLIRNISVT
ncbi:hypothetical protein FACS1894120_4230 [Clostridia bacterium]|nr:hypothetical protein FACS1894120_4230 [Clostridia bacterium]